MSNNGDFAATMYESDPIVAALNKVPGFDPLKLMSRRKIPGAEKEERYLDFRYKKLWFRLAHQKGRIRLNKLSVTEQLAIIEAQVYLELTDANPVSSFTAACTREEAGDKYIESAQIKAMDQALTDAGFGLQFVPAPTGSMENTAPQTAAASAANVQMSGTAPKTVQTANTAQKGQAPATDPVVAQSVIQKGQQAAARQKAPLTQASATAQQAVRQAADQQKTVAVQAAAQQRTVAPQQAAAQQKTVAVQATAQQCTTVSQAAVQQKTMAAQATVQQRAAVQQPAAQRQTAPQQRTVTPQQAVQQSAAQQRPATAQSATQQTTVQQSAAQQRPAAAQQTTAAPQQRTMAQPQPVQQSAARQAAVSAGSAQAAQKVQNGAARPAQAGMQKAAGNPAASTVPQKSAAVASTTPQMAAQQQAGAGTLPAGQSLPVAPDVAAAMSMLSGKGEADTLPVTPEGAKAVEKTETMAEELPGGPMPTTEVSAVQNTAASAETAPIAQTVPAPVTGQAAKEAKPYTETTPVEEILQSMTLEDAKKVIVPTGTCRGWTLDEVAQRRRPSLRFYLSEGYQGRDNILRAAARLVLDDLEKKAG